MWILFLLLGCAKEVPPHLAVVDNDVQETTRPSLARLVGHDPLLRRPDPLQQGDWADVPGGHAIKLWAKTARRQSALPADWSTVEAAAAGTIGVPLARGARLAAIEVIGGEWDETLQQRIAAWMGLTGVEAQPATSTPAEPLAWLSGVSGEEKLNAAKHIATRLVLEGWFDDPNIDQSAASKALATNAHTLLADSPYGQLMLARADGATDAEALTSGGQFFWEATAHALAWAAADTDAEQKEALAARQQFRQQRGTTPAAWNLDRARRLLTMDAANDAAAGLALVTIAAERLENSCPDAPCGGLYIVASLTRAGQWHESAAAGAAVWHVIALKRALDSLRSSIDKPSLYRRLPHIADALTGLSEDTIELSFLRHRVASPAMMLNISRMAGGKPTSDADQAIEAVAKRLQQACDRALEQPIPTAHVSVIKRIWVSAENTK